MADDKERGRLLIVEDDQSFRDTLMLEFQDSGFDVKAVGSWDEFNAFEKADFDFAVVDLKLGEDSGLRIVERLKRQLPDCHTIVLTGYGSIATAVKAMKLGARNFLTKPASIAQILAALDSDDTSMEFVESQPSPTLAFAEREYIESVIARCNGNITRAAAVLGLHRQSLQRKMRKYKVTR